jgi:hypothetical protein
MDKKRTHVKTRRGGKRAGTATCSSHDLAEVTTYIGTDIGDPYSPLAEHAPHSARHVASVSWSWSPAHSRMSQYRISTDRGRQMWRLYEVGCGFDSGRRLHSLVATGSPYRGVAAERAALTLLRAAWQAEVEIWEFKPAGVQVDQDGLLSKQDIAALVEELEFIGGATWLRDQSKESLSVLRELLPNPLDEQSIEVIEEIETCAKELGLSQIFLSLCMHYDISPPSLAPLILRLLKEATVLREERKLEAVDRVQKFKREIEIMCSELSTESIRGGGITAPSLRTKVNTFLEKYVGLHDELPQGQHKVHDRFGPSVDFDALRMKYRL